MKNQFNILFEEAMEQFNVANQIDEFLIFQPFQIFAQGERILQLKDLTISVMFKQSSCFKIIIKKNNKIVWVHGYPPDYNKYCLIAKEQLLQIINELINV